MIKKMVIFSLVMGLLFTSPVASAQSGLVTKNFFNVEVIGSNAFLRLTDQYYFILMTSIDIAPTKELKMELSGVPASSLFVAELYYKAPGSSVENLIAVADIPSFGNNGYNRNIVGFSFTRDEWEKQNLRWLPNFAVSGYKVKLKKKPNVFSSTVMNMRGTVTPVDDLTTQKDEAISDDVLLGSVESTVITWGIIYEDKSTSISLFQNSVRAALHIIQRSWKDDNENDIELIQSSTDSISLTSAGAAYLFNTNKLFRSVLHGFFPATVEISDIQTEGFKLLNRDLRNEQVLNGTKAHYVLSEAAESIEVPFHVFTAMVVGIGFSGIILLIFKLVSRERNTLVIIWMFILIVTSKIGLTHISVVIFPTVIIVFGLLYSKLFMRSSS